jgi:hypothetical protein
VCGAGCRSLEAWAREVRQCEQTTSHCICLSHRLLYYVLECENPTVCDTGLENMIVWYLYRLANLLMYVHLNAY